MKRILCSAIWIDDGKEYVHQPKNIVSGFVVCGRRHHNCFNTISLLGYPREELIKHKQVQGFLTDSDEFIDRRFAGVIAFNSGQIKNTIDVLYSEDLW